MPALEPMPGLRVVADPGTLDGARWTAVGIAGGSGDVGPDADRILVLRIAPDEAFALGATEVQVDDPHAIVEEERGIVGGWCALTEVTPHLEWSLPSQRPALAQGSVAGVPAKILLPDHETEATATDQVLVVTAAAYADVLAERLGWRR